MVPTPLLKFLAELPNVHGPHTSNTLLNHLKGTYLILQQWNCENHICVAGLFHSVYGTRAYHSVSLDASSRCLLRELIGDEAETLVHAFHLANWGAILRDARHAAEVAELSPGLFEIAIANLVEQVPRLVATVQDKNALLGAVRAHLSLERWLPGPARRSLRQLLDHLTLQAHVTNDGDGRRTAVL